MRQLIALFALALVALGLTAAYTPSTYTVIDLEGLGAVGDGVAVNNAVFSAGFSQAANGGMIRLPCGVFKVTTTPGVTVAAGKHVDLVGSGQDCTVILVSGAVNGPTITLTDQWSSVRVADLTIATDQAGTTNCLMWIAPFTNAASAYAASSVLERVAFRGSDSYGAGTKYCGKGLFESSVSNINIDKVTYQGILSRAGSAISLHGSGTGGTYSVQINITNSVFNNCDSAVFYGDWVQGLQFATSNVTGCNTGIQVVGAPAGNLAQLAVSLSQFNTFSCGVCVNDTLFNNLQVANTQFIVEAGSTGIKAQGTNFSIVGNEINGTSTSGTGIAIQSTFGNGGVVADANIINLGTGISVSSLSQSPVKVQNNVFVNNTADYSINGSSRGTVVVDTQPRNYAVVAAQLPCNAAITYSTVWFADIVGSTYNATVAAGGGANFVGGRCDGTRWYQG